MIQGFACKETMRFFTQGRSAKFANIAAIASRKLTQLDNAEELRDLASPPGNRLELLVGDRQGRHSIRINGQFRLCFRWTESGPADVEIVDYH